MIDSIDAARAVCEFRSWRISNLVLHKMLYMAHGSYMAEHGGPEKPLIDGHFQAWDYGPVEPDLYRKFNMFGSDWIQEYALTIKDKTAAPDTKKPEVAHIQRIVEQLAQYSPAQLVHMTHMHGGAWSKHYIPNKWNIIIPNEDIYDEYKRYRKQ